MDCFTLQCLSVEEIVEIFGIKHGEKVPISSLPEISLATFQQLAGGYCRNALTTTPSPRDVLEPTTFQSMV